MTATADTKGTVAGASPPSKPVRQARAWTPVPRLYGSFFVLLFVVGLLAFSAPLGYWFGTEELRSTRQTMGPLTSSEILILADHLLQPQRSEQASSSKAPQADRPVDLGDKAHADAVQQDLAAQQQHLASAYEQLQNGATRARAWHVRIVMGVSAAAACLLACLIWCYLLNLRWGKKALMQGTLVAIIVCTASFGWLWRVEKEYSRHLEQGQARALSFASASFLEKAQPAPVVLANPAVQVADIRGTEGSVLGDLHKAEAQVKYAPFASIGFLFAALVYWLTVRAATREYRQRR